MSCSLSLSVVLLSCAGRESYDALLGSAKGRGILAAVHYVFASYELNVGIDDPPVIWA